MNPVMKTPGQPWARIPSKYTVTGKVVSVRFSYEFNERLAYFAMCFPWSYSDNQNFLSGLPRRQYYKRESLGQTPDGREIDLLTIGYEAPEKPHVVLSARVHPGELPASHIMNGIIKFLFSEDPRAVLLRQKAVFKIVPMLNPDGVFRGHFRFDKFGVNLNRRYIDPDPVNEPTIFKVKELVNQLHSEGKYFLGIDLHAHANKRGFFLFGNHFDFIEQVECCKLA